MDFLLVIINVTLSDVTIGVFLWKLFIQHCYVCLNNCCQF